MMNYRNYLFPISLLCIAVCVWCITQTVSAQAPYQPPLSPWLNMYKSNPGPMGNYLGNVKPQIDMNKAMAELQRNQGTMQQALQSQSSAMMGGGSGGQLLNDGSAQGVLAEPRLTRSMSGGAGYNQTLHYYPGGLPRQNVPYFSTPRTGRRY